MTKSLTKSLQHCCRLFALLALSCSQLPAQTPADAPQSFAPAVQQMTIPPLPPPRRYAEAIEPGQTPLPFSPAQKVIFSFTEVARPITLLPGLYSAGYEQIFDTDPKYGNDLGAFGEKLGAAMLRSASVRVFADGVLAAAFHQDPRYYRIANGSIFHRSLLSAEQALVRRSDGGNPQFNYSGIAGRAVAAALVVTYYPQPSITAHVVGLTFATSIASDAGGNLVLEFLPNIVRKFPIMKRLRIE